VNGGGDVREVDAEVVVHLGQCTSRYVTR
jgi:hypothetical protein